MEDNLMAKVTASVQRGRAGEPDAARAELESLWAQVEHGGGDDFHRCVIAHFLADLQDDQRDELMWDERALAAVHGVSDERAQRFDQSLQVRGFMPSLYASLADDHRRLGDLTSAHEFLEKAEAASDALGEDAYGALVKGIIGQVRQALAEGSTEPLPT
ncbi:hypothetical protein [Lentzea cavernae]|uniref:Tetratricopeptide repeat-containing protein n=1 Tax=Lentzea cavernae TaxID=2020703 RepID=A0ABQ3ME67_9PSEU|nr:hypothetical protein [Lentzea cavernae]GHH39256.1 hypothetical protein GCM10017774_30610 [Lentzea cavernae]